MWGEAEARWSYISMGVAWDRWSAVSASVRPPSESPASPPLLRSSPLCPRLDLHPAPPCEALVEWAWERASIDGAVAQRNQVPPRPLIEALTEPRGTQAQLSAAWGLWRGWVRDWCQLELSLGKAEGWQALRGLQWGWRPSGFCRK